MKNLLILTFAVLMIASCSKETALVIEVPEIEESVLSNLSVAAVYANSEESTINSENHACGANYVENTEIGLFFEQDGITDESSMSSANFVNNTGNGIAYFENLQPGNYTILASNDMGTKVKISSVKVGNNDISIEF